MKTLGPSFTRYVYGVFDSEFRCIYVGQTRNLISRSAAHRRKFGELFNFVVLAPFVSSPDCTAFETLCIHWFRNQCHPIRNKRDGIPSLLRYDEREFIPHFERVDTGEKFACYSHIAAVFGVSAGPVSGWFRDRRYRNPDGTATIQPYGFRPMKFRILFPGSCDY